MSKTFFSVNEAVLVETIGRAKDRLVFIAPGLRPPVAEALEGAMSNVPHPERLTRRHEDTKV
ncbi:MAG: hypothetical protein WEB60_01190 [Terrimicrobiaceae bacterium]